MNNDQFIYWLKGYAAGHEHAPTPKQWETIVSELDKIKDCPDFGSPIEVTGIPKYSRYTPSFPDGTNIATTSPPYTLTTAGDKDVVYTLNDKNK